MARPTKQGIDYFPIDVDLDKDDKLQMIVAEFGIKGENIYTKLLSYLYKHNGYFLHWTEEDQLKFTHRFSYMGVSIDLIRHVVARCIKWGLFDKALFDAHGILTSERIQRTWVDATRKRKDRFVDPKIWLLLVNDGNFPEETELPPEATKLSTGDNTQSRVKETKEEKSKKKESRVKRRESRARSDIFEFFKTAMLRNVKNLDPLEQEILLKREKAIEERPAEIDHVENWFMENCVTLKLSRMKQIQYLARKFFNHYQKTGWKDVHGKDIVDVVSAVEIWVETEKEKKSQTA